MRKMVAAILAACGLAIAPGAVGPAHAMPADCPPICDRIPNSAWIDPTQIPLYPTYRWPGLAGVAVTTTNPRFRFEEACASPPVPDDPRGYAVSARATVPQPDGQWQLQVQVMHWRGETWRGGQLATSVFDAAVASLRNCPLTTPQYSALVTTGEPTRAAAVISGPQVVHQYLIVDPQNSTVSELALWMAPGPGQAPQAPLVPWPMVPDAQVFDAMAAPLCGAYVGSCG